MLWFRIFETFLDRYSLDIHSDGEIFVVKEMRTHMNTSYCNIVLNHHTIITHEFMNLERSTKYMFLPTLHHGVLFTLTLLLSSAICESSFHL